MGKLLNMLSNNHVPIEIAEAHAELGEGMLIEGEVIELAFRKKGEGGRDKLYLTSHRLLIQNGKGLGNKRKVYKSILYKSLKGYAIETVGGSLDRDTELKIWYEGGDGSETIDFAKKSVDIFELKRFFNAKVLDVKNLPSGASHQTRKTPSHKANLWDWIGDDAVQVDSQSVQDRFGPWSSTGVLEEGETVDLAYRSRKDFFILTPLRFLMIDFHLLSSKVEFISLPWKVVRAFTVETAGSWDWDCEFVVHTKIPSMRHIQQDLRSTKTDIFDVQMAFNEKLLGASADGKTIETYRNEGHVDPGPSIFGGSNNRPLDASVVEGVFRSNPKILRDDESVDMAFRGYRDLVLFTTLRIINVDVKGWSGKKVQYTSIPYSSILAYAVQSAGKHDWDAEVMIYTDIRYEVPQGSEDPEPDPGMSYLTWDFNKNFVNILDLKRYLNQRLLARETIGNVIPKNLFQAASKEEGVENLLSKLGGDQRTINAEELDVLLHTTHDILLDDESVVMAFQCGRDISCFTNKRIFLMDTQGWSGKKVEYLSLPLTSIRGFSAESAGEWDRDATVNVYTGNYWFLDKLSLDFRKGKADVIAIQNFLSAVVLGNEEDATSFLKQVNPETVKIEHPSSMNGFTDWIVDFSVEQDPQVANSQFHSDPPILLSHENVEKVYREGRDLWVYTNLRLLQVNVKGFSGKKIKYKSIPIQKSVASFAVETPGHLDVDGEVYVHTNMPKSRSLTQRILVERGDVMDMHRYLSKKLLDAL